MSRTMKPITCLLLAITFALVVFNTAWAGKTPPPPVPVEYHVTFIGSLAGEETEVRAIDALGVAYGRSFVPVDNIYHGTLWSSTTGLIDFNTVIAPWTDLQTGQPTSGWTVRSLFDVNTSGQIVGDASCGTVIRAFVYDDVSGFALLPTIAEGRHSGYAINEQGDVQGLYFPPGTGTIWKNYFWTPSDPGKITVIEPDATSYVMQGGIGNGVFMSVSSVLDVAKVYSYVYMNGVLSYQPISTKALADGGNVNTYINNSGAFAYVGNGRRTQFIKLYRPGQSDVTVHESSSYTHEVGYQANNSHDFVYQVNKIPYLYRASENKSYKLYDLADSYTKNVLFASSAGDVRNSTVGISSAVIGDDNGVGLPTSDPFDTIGGYLYDQSSPSPCSVAFVLIPVPK